MTSNELTIGGVLLSVAVAFIIYSLQRKRKLLSYSIQSATKLIQVNDRHLARRVTLLVDGSEAPDVTVLQIRISNEGNVPISSSDYEQPLCINLGIAVEVVSADCSTSGEQVITTGMGVKGNTVTLQPCLLNPKDRIEITILASHYTQPPVIIGRIVGVRTIRDSSEGLRWRPKWLNPLLPFIAGAIPLGSLIFTDHLLHYPLVHNYPTVSGMTVGAIAAIAIYLLSLLRR